MQPSQSYQQQQPPAPVYQAVAVPVVVGGDGRDRSISTLSPICGVQTCCCCGASYCNMCAVILFIVAFIGCILSFGSLLHKETLYVGEAYSTNSTTYSFYWDHMTDANGVQFKYDDPVLSQYIGGCNKDGKALIGFLVVDFVLILLLVPTIVNRAFGMKFKMFGAHPATVARVQALIAVIITALYIGAVLSWSKCMRDSGTGLENWQNTNGVKHTAKEDNQAGVFGFISFCFALTVIALIHSCVIASYPKAQYLMSYMGSYPFNSERRDAPYHNQIMVHPQNQASPMPMPMQEGFAPPPAYSGYPQMIYAPSGYPNQQVTIAMGIPVEGAPPASFAAAAAAGGEGAAMPASGGPQSALGALQMKLESLIEDELSQISANGVAKYKLRPEISSVVFNFEDVSNPSSDCPLLVVDVPQDYPRRPITISMQTGSFTENGFALFTEVKNRAVALGMTERLSSDVIKEAIKKVLPASDLLEQESPKHIYPVVLCFKQIAQEASQSKGI